MARRPNYGAEKRQKELKRQQKQNAKAEKKRLKKEEAERSGLAGDALDEEPGADRDEDGGSGASTPARG